ncbi:hypothetical protein AVEN_27341-1 [Araneus ventricosus]|uniref:RRM domain-containing protein n=1 Tax=Araneus ventricosus TaxID=182803 RepID=A0A4Y2GMZ3_ARAVE|nr:hypothetical protein AVEN_27341-1 [Araneus ventricosus]
MLLDDSIELECNDSSASAESLPVNWDIDLSKIWIPSCVLPNRKKQINPNENKPFILYTLEKPDYSKTFSVYSDESPQYHESQTSPAVSSRISHHKLIDDNNDKHEIQQALPSFQNAVELDAILDIGSEKVISPKHPLNNNEPDDSLRDCQETYNYMIRNAAQWEKKASDAYSVQEASYRASLEDLTRRMAEILSEEEPLKENWHHEDVIKTNQVATDSTLDSIPPSTKDSLEELYYSDEDENHFAVEYELDNLELESPEKKPTCSIYTEISYVLEQPSESFVNDLEKAKNGSDETVPQSFEETEKIEFENQKVAVDNVFSQSEHGELNGSEFVVHTKDSEQELLNSEEKSEDPTEKVLEFPIAYKRPPLQEQTNKSKPQKEKKKTKKAKINIPLGDLFQREEFDRFKVPEVDEFYENLVRQGKCKPCNQQIDINAFPSVNFTEELQTNVSESPSINLPDQPQNLFWDSAQKFRESLSSEPQSNSPDEIIRNEEKAEPELETKDSLATIVIDNIPLNVSKENIESFILGYGELKNLTIERHRNVQRAKLQMDFMCEVDWIIDCLNDSQPFGSFNKELIKCYRQA